MLCKLSLWVVFLSLWLVCACSMMPPASISNYENKPQPIMAPSTPAAQDKAVAPVEKKAPAARPSISGLKAGFTDDNKQFNYFVQFLEEYQERVRHYPLAVQERIVLYVEDSNHKPVANALVEIRNNNQLLCSGRTFADGGFLFFPGEYEPGLTDYEVTVFSDENHQQTSISRDGERHVTIALPAPRQALNRVPLDVLFIFDTTGSMGEEIDQLKKTLSIIQMNLSETVVATQLRLGMVLFRDRGDEYVTHLIPLTSDVEQFRSELDKVTADAGGDTPEDLQAALQVAMQQVEWNQGGIRLAFIITDAPPHLDYSDQTYTYVKAAADAKKNGIKLFTIGCGDLDIQGEYILRQISQYTSAKYIFMTYGEKNDSEGGRPGSVSHHVGDRFTSERLETIIIRIAKQELQHMSEQPVEKKGDNYAYVTRRQIEQTDDYIEANRISDEQREETLQKLFDMALGQLVNYSAKRIEPQTRTAVVPLYTDDEDVAKNSNYFTAQIEIVLVQKKSDVFQIVARADLEKALAEMKMTRSAMFDRKTMPQVGKLLGAQMLVIGNLYRRPNCYDLHLKLLRVETGEILAGTQAKVDVRLGESK